VSVRRYPDIADVVEASGGIDKVRLVIEPMRRPGASPPPPKVADSVEGDWGQPLPPAVATGMEELDELVGGLRAESVYVMNAASGRGKTGLALQFARHIARSRSVLYFSSELTRRQISARLAAQVLGEPWKRLYDAGPSESGRIRGALLGLNLRAIELTRNMNVVQLAQDVANDDGEAPIIFLDYLQHAARRMNPDDRRLATAALSDDLSSWARQVASTAFVVSSVSRANYSTEGKKSARDFEGAAKESGDIDYDAAALLFLDTDECPPGGTAAAKLHVSKNRFGGGGTVGLRFDGARGTFEPDARSSMSEGHWEVLELMRSSGTMSSNDIADELGGRKKDVLGLVRDLLNRGLIERTAQRLLRVTEGGNDAR
jgi:hypothetical protein